MLTKTQLAQILSFIADILSDGADAAEAQTAAATSGEAAAKRPGRPRKGAGAVPVVESTPATTVAPTEQPTTAAPAPAETKPADVIKGAKTLEELKQLIQPLIKAARGTEVKAVINKYKPEGHDGDYTLSLLSEQPQHHAAFVADIETLSM